MWVTTTIERYSEKKREEYLVRTVITRTSLVLLLIGLFSIATVEHAIASHSRYGTLSWAPTGSPGEVAFRLTAAFRRDAYGEINTNAIITEVVGPTALDFGDNSSTPTLQFLITAHSVTENWIIGEALHPGTSNIGIRHTYPAAGPFTAHVGACCRIAALNNRTDGPYRLETTVFPQGVNSSPVSTQAPIVVVPASSAATFLVPASDPNGDPIRWRLSTDAEAGGGGPSSRSQR